MSGRLSHYVRRHLQTNKESRCTSNQKGHPKVPFHSNTALEAYGLVVDAVARVETGFV
jgi:hypothetical protein